MTNPAKNKPAHAVAPDLARALGVRRANRLKSIVKHTGLPAEVLMDLAIELLDIASRKLSPAPIQRTAIGLGAARWRNVSPEERSELLRRAVQARWAKQRRGES
jgi:hypothetical protein